MSAYNPPCQAELTFMHVLPTRLTGMTEAMTKLAAAMNGLTAAVERHNALAEKNQVSVQPLASDAAVGLPAPYETRNGGSRGADGGQSHA